MPPEAGAPPVPGALLDRPLAQLCNKARLLDLIRNFIMFDAGQKKEPRQHQFFGVKAAQARIGTQGSGKSILMVLIAKWLMEHDPEARILVITDRDELDKQIVGVMKNSGVISPEAPSPGITSRAESVESIRSKPKQNRHAVLEIKLTHYRRTRPRLSWPVDLARRRAPATSGSARQGRRGCYRCPACRGRGANSRR